jgi:ornithine decarboxylase
MQYCIKGVTPCSLDLFRYRVYLRRVSVGDKLIFLNAGAYNFSSNFCNLIIPDVKVVE